MKYGTIVQISESVVDVKFEQGQLPRVRESVVVSAGVKCWVMEVAQHLGNSTVRCVLLTKNDGLTRGMMAGHSCQIQRSGEAFIGKAQDWKSGRQRRKCWKPGSRQSICCVHTPKAERSVCLQVPDTVKERSPGSSSVT